MEMNYRVYCVYRSPYFCEGLQIKRFIYSANMPPLFFKMDHQLGQADENSGTNDQMTSSDQELLAKHHSAVEELVQSHSAKIFGSRRWTCNVCGSAATKLLHGVIPHFELLEEGETRAGGEAKPYLGEGIAIPLTQLATYQGYGMSQEDAQNANAEASGAAPKLADGATGPNLYPCVVDVANPVCNTPECASIADDFGKDLSKGLLGGCYKADQEQMPWWSPKNNEKNESTVPETALAPQKFVRCAMCSRYDEKGFKQCSGCRSAAYVYFS